MLLPDPDPASLDIAQDLCEEYGLKLADLGKAMAQNGPSNRGDEDGITAGWAEPGEFPSAGEFLLTDVLDTKSPEYMAVSWMVWGGDARRKRLRKSFKAFRSNYSLEVICDYRGWQWGETHDGARGLRPVIPQRPPGSRVPDSVIAQQDRVRDLPSLFTEGGGSTLAIAERRAIDTAWRIAKVMKEHRAVGSDAVDVITALREGTRPSSPPRAIINPPKKPRGAPPGIFGLAGDLLGAAVNPQMTSDEAFSAFHDIIRDPDPAAMQIAEDLVLEHKLSLVDLSISGSDTGHFSLGALHPADAPVYRVEWTVSPVYPRTYGSYEAAHAAKPRYAIEIRYLWNNAAQQLVTGGGRYMATRDGTLRAAAADAWAVAKRMKELMVEGRTDELPRPMFWVPGPGDDMTIHDELFRAYQAEDKTAPEIYEHRSTRSKKQRTYLEARDDIWAFLNRADWMLSSADLRTPHATSPNGWLRLWFKPQAVHYTYSPAKRHAQGSAHSVSYDLDIRKITPTEFLDLIKRKFPGGFKP